MNAAIHVARFRALHEGPTFVLANAWSPGSARRLAAMGFMAIGTTSGGIALELGVEDGEAGASIEDAPADRNASVYPFEPAVARVRAAVEAIRASGRDLVLTARAENHLHGVHDLQDTIARLEAFAAAGADVLFAPCLPDLAAVRQVRARLAKPLNVLIGYEGCPYTVADLAAIGVNRVSLGSLLARAARQGMEAVARRLVQPHVAAASAGAS